MQTRDFSKRLDSKKLKENISKQFGIGVELRQYDREQLEDFRNKLRTKIFQAEGSSGINDLLHSESYQKDKAMLQLLNTRIKEMLGEDLKKLRDKIDALEEAKKGVRAPKYTKKAKGSNDGDLANNYPPFDKVTRGDVIAGATGKDQKGGNKKKDVKADEGRRISGKGYDNPEHDSKPPEGKVPFTSFHQGKQGDQAARLHATQVKGKLVKGKAQSAKQNEPGVKEASDKCNHTPKGKKCPVHGLKECGTYEGAMSNLDADRKDKAYQKRQGKFDPLKHVKDPTPGEKAAAKDVKRGSYADRAALLKSAERDGRLKESQEMFKRHVRTVNESLAYLLSENEEEKAKAITAAGDIVNDYTSWMQRVGQYQTKSMIELADKIRADFGPSEAEAFKQAVGPALSQTLEMLTQQREAISNAVAALAGEQMPTEPMGMEPGMEPGVDASAPDMMNTGGDEFAAADAAAGGPETSGREMRESKFSRKLAESHSIISKLAR